MTHRVGDCGISGSVFAAARLNKRNELYVVRVSDGFSGVVLRSVDYSGKINIQPITGGYCGGPVEHEDRVEWCSKNWALYEKNQIEAITKREFSTDHFSEEMWYEYDTLIINLEDCTESLSVP